MKYVLLIYHEEAEQAQMSEAEQKELTDAYWAYSAELKQAGVVLGSNALYPTMTAKSVRVRNGQTLSIDGPFAETKEQLGGLYLIEVDSEEQAIQWAAKIPTAKSGTIEVRPVIEF